MTMVDEDEAIKRNSGAKSVMFKKEVISMVDEEKKDNVEDIDEAIERNSGAKSVIFKEEVVSMVDEEKKDNVEDIDEAIERNSGAKSVMFKEEVVSMVDEEKNDTGTEIEGHEPLNPLYRQSVGVIYSKLKKDEAGVDPFIFYTALISTHTLVPLDVLLSIFNEADENGDGILSIDELGAFLRRYEESCESSRKIDQTMWSYSIKSFWKDKACRCDFLYTIAGILLVVAAVGNAFSLSSQVQSNIYFSASIMYFIAGWRSLISYTKSKWIKMAGYEKMFKVFIERVLAVAREFYGDEKDDKAVLRTYVDEVLYQDNMIESLSKYDLELLIFKEIGLSIDTSVLQYIWGKQKFNQNTQFVKKDELYKFLTSPPKENFTCTEKFFYVVWRCMKSIVWLMCVCYSAAGSVSLITKIIPRLPGGSPVNFGFTTPFMVSSWLYLIGTMYFSAVTGEGIASSYYYRLQVSSLIEKWLDELEKGKENTLRFSIFAASEDSTTTSCRTKLIDKFINDGGFKRMAFCRLLEEECGIHLPINEVDVLFDDIDRNKNGKVSESDLREFVNRKTNQSGTLAIFCLCVKSFYFWAQFIWFVGSINYLLSAYGVWGVGNDILGAIFYLVGGITLSIHQLQDKRMQFFYVSKVVSALKSGKHHDIQFDSWQNKVKVAGGDIRGSSLARRSRSRNRSFFRIFRKSSVESENGRGSSFFRLSRPRWSRSTGRDSSIESENGRDSSFFRLSRPRWSRSTGRDSSYSHEYKRASSKNSTQPGEKGRASFFHSFFTMRSSTQT